MGDIDTLGYEATYGFAAIGEFLMIAGYDLLKTAGWTVRFAEKKTWYKGREPDSPAQGADTPVYMVELVPGGPFAIGSAQKILIGLRGDHHRKPLMVIPEAGRYF